MVWRQILRIEIKMEYCDSEQGHAQKQNKRQKMKESICVQPFFLSLENNMQRIVVMIVFSMFAFLSKGQNKVGFETMINSLISTEVDTITSLELKERLAYEHWVILDAREREEYDVSHLPDAQYVGYDDFDLNRLNGVKKSDAIVIYCSVGKRSGDVGKKLLVAGYTNVLNLYGGIFDWTNRGNQVVNEKNEPVRCVHPYSPVWGYWINNYEKCYEPR